jgi:hypothetical protein
MHSEPVRLLLLTSQNVFYTLPYISEHDTLCYTNRIVRIGVFFFHESQLFSQRDYTIGECKSVYL